MSSAVKLRVAALRFLGATIFGAVVVGVSAAGSVAAPTTTVSVLVPIVSDTGDGQLLGPDELESETSEDGDWTLLTDSATRHGFTVALDSRIVASITALGNDAPASAVDWLEDVTALDPLLLPWGNADIWALTPTTSTAFSATQFGELAGVESTDMVVWPSGSVIRGDSIMLTSTRGFSRVIVGDDVLAGGFDAQSSAILADAIAPDSTTHAQAGAVAVVAAHTSGSAIALPADPASLDAAKARDLLDSLARAGTRIARFIPVVVNSTHTPLRTVDGPARLTELLEAIDADHERAALITDRPDELILDRVKSLAVVTRNVAAPEFESAASAYLADTNWLAGLVSISLATEYTVLSNTAEVPVSVSNDSLATVTIDVHVRSTSGIVQVEQPSQSVTIEPQSNVRITVPMTAVANGRTALVASLSDASGGAIGNPVTFPIEVQAQWEILTVVVFFGSVVVIMTIGILRTIRRRRVSA